MPSKQQRQLRIVARQQHQGSCLFRRCLWMYRRVVDVTAVDCGRTSNDARPDEGRRGGGGGKQPLRFPCGRTIVQCEEFLTQSEITRQAGMDALPDVLVRQIGERAHDQRAGQTEEPRGTCEGHMYPGRRQAQPLERKLIHEPFDPLRVYALVSETELQPGEAGPFHKALVGRVQPYAHVERGSWAIGEARRRDRGARAGADQFLWWFPPALQPAREHATLPPAAIAAAGEDKRFDFGETQGVDPLHGKQVHFSKPV